MGNKRQVIGPPIPPPPAPSLRLSKFSISQQYKIGVPDTLLNRIEKYTFTQPNEQIRNVFDIIQYCGIAIPSIFGPIHTPNEFHDKILKAYHHSLRVLLFYHYRKGGSLQSIIKYRDNILILDSNVNARSVIWQFAKSENTTISNTNKWHFLYHENKMSNKKLIVFRDIRTHMLNDYAKYLISLLNISNDTAIQLLTMLLYKTLSCSENSFLRLVKTLFSSLSNYYLSLLSQIAVEFIKHGNMPIETLRRLADRWLPIFISQETPHTEALFVQIILSSPDQLAHLHTSTVGENCHFCSNSLLFLLSLIRTSRQFLSILAKYHQASKTAFTLFVSLAKDERFGDSSLMLRAEATNAIVQLWLSPAKFHILTLGPSVIHILGEICRLQTIQINVWKPLVEDCIDDNRVKLLDIMSSNVNHFDKFRIYREIDTIDYSLKMDNLYTVFSRQFLRPYCVTNLDHIDTSYYLAPLIVNYLTKTNVTNEQLQQGIAGVLVRLLCEMTTKAPLAYLFSARLSLFIHWISLHRCTLLKLGIKGLLSDDPDVTAFQNGEYLNKLPDNHIYDLNESKQFYLTLPEMSYNDTQQLGVSKVLFGIMEADNKQGLALLDFLCHITIHYYPSAKLSYLSLILSMYSEMDRDIKSGETVPFVNAGNNFKFSKYNIVSIISLCLGVKRIIVTLKGLSGCCDEINKPLEYIFSKKYPVSPNVKVAVNIQYDINKSKLEIPLLKLVLRHLLEFYIDRRINAKYYRHLHLTNLSISDLACKGVNVNDEKIGTVTPQLQDAIRRISLKVSEFNDIPTFLSVFSNKLINSSGELDDIDNTDTDSVGFYEFINRMAENFNGINFDNITNASNQFDKFGQIITSHFIAKLISIHLFGDSDDAYTRLTACLSKKYTLTQVINCIKHNQSTDNEILPFLMNETEFKDLVGDHAAVNDVTIIPFNMLTNNTINGNHGGSIGLLKWKCDWLLVCAKITSSMAVLGSIKAGNILSKIEKQVHGSLMSKISVNDKRDLRVSTLLPYKQLDLALNKIAEFLQATNNVEYVCIALNILWNLVISSLPRVNLVSPLIKILLTVNSQMNNPQIMNFQVNNLNTLASLVTTIFLLWITADPLQSLIAFTKVTPSGSPSSVVSWRSIENFVKYSMRDSSALECRFNDVNLQFAEFTLPLAHKIFMGNIKI
ncbi:hypothetical protein BMR1_02g01735 [Babesia microti strain RI]|uniref:Uncharacterized protein n=1 Tax=Babesia microti (strain RI) TaxID=1133968 RepID=I7IGA2_BABMR|nr:hypothetical protein BMR1_02g01735 [Babesia microti strain RI]CCF73506.1 hypothetical protein BMR1_02g01735 [Babesia microti strain RI]|eukprot:XP_012648115.1 hypothetical protein BMR1_02g01735 [Babesia microti strain RI]